jgi:hypothetical protein
MYFSSESLETGEIVTLAGGLSVGRARIADRERIIGVVSTQPGLTLGADDSSLRTGEQAYPIALSGRVPIRLSTENGPIRKGDRIMLSSLPGIGMKATGTGMVVGIALEDFDPDRAYSETFINQFGENLIVPEFAPIVPNDPRIHDGCYFGAGGASGEAPCVPLTATSSDGQQQEAARIAAAEAKERALRALAQTPSARRSLPDGQLVSVGQIVMFVDLSYRYLDAEQSDMLALLAGTVVPATEEEIDSDTLFGRITQLASRFVDGVLAIIRLEADEVATDRLCVGTTCVDEATLRGLLEQSGEQGGTAAESLEQAPNPPVPSGESLVPEMSASDPSVVPSPTSSDTGSPMTDTGVVASIPEAALPNPPESGDSSTETEVVAVPVSSGASTDVSSEPTSP